jgi:hypothetical protein
VIIASTTLCFLGVMFGSLPFVPALRPLPRWIRTALHLSGLALLLAGLLYAALGAAGSRLSPELHRLIFAHVALIAGMGLGILLLLVISGEYMKALRELARNRQNGSHV